MHSTNLTPSPYESSLRKVAILLTGLDDQSAYELLSQMDDASAQAARDAMEQLGPVDAAEQAEVIAEFLGGIGVESHKSDADIAADNAAVELDASLARKLASDSSLSSSTDDGAAEQPAYSHDRAEPVTPWQRIHATPARELAACLAAENPQLVAVILAQLSTAHAAETLQCLPGALQGDLLGRIARAVTPAAVLLADIGQWLDQRLSLTVQPLIDRDSQQFPAPHPSARRSRPTSFAEPRDDACVTVKHATASAARIEDQDRREQRDGTHRTAAVTSFAQLIDLGDERLALVLRQASPLEVVLAVAGAAPNVARRWLERLPESERRHMQRTLTNLGPWRLSDATAAQDRLVELANRPVNDATTKGRRTGT